MANSWMAECGCRINDICPLHAAAPALKNALEEMTQMAETNNYNGMKLAVSRAQAALAQANGSQRRRIMNLDHEIYSKIHHYCEGHVREATDAILRIPLVHSAPALLEALETMLAEAGTRYSSGTEQARAAIELARGEKNGTPNTR